MIRPSKSDEPKRTVTPIVRRNLGSDVYSVLWDRILSRSLHPGEKLSDLHLSDELGVSRTPVREALHRLVQDGVVSYHPNRGFYVASFSQTDIVEILISGPPWRRLPCAAWPLRSHRMTSAALDRNCSALAS